MLQYWCEILVIGVSLAMDALAVSAAIGAAFGARLRMKQVLIPGLMFGFFQTAMPLLGWAGCELIGEYLRYAGRVIATVLLLWIGIKMIRERTAAVSVIFTVKRLAILAFATSIDALMVGVSFSCLERSMTWIEPTLFGVITAGLSWSGTLVGRRFGNMLNGHCGLAGGIMLIVIGLKVAVFG